MSEDLRTVRLPFMVTQAEAEAIDEWRYAHKVPTRAEAMRRLIQYGLAYENGVAIVTVMADALIRALKNEDVESETLTLIASSLREASSTMVKLEEISDLIDNIEIAGKAAKEKGGE